MKKLLIVLFCLVTGAGVQAYAQKGPMFKFEGGDTYDFGVIKRGPGAKHTFEFTNVGDQPIIVMNVTPSCGCTNVDWSKTPVLPGQKGYVQLELKTEEQHGVFNKEVYIQSNAKTPHGEKRYTIYIKGDAKDQVPGK
jgi:hypothetical protein